MTLLHEFQSGEQLCCEHGHPFARWREPVEHGIMHCDKVVNRTRPDQHSCESRVWVLQLEGGRRLVVSVTEKTASAIKDRRMSAHEVLDLLDLIQRKAS